MKHEGLFGKCKLFTEGYAYVIFRVIIGLLFILHGSMKFGSGIPSNWMMLVAGTIELLGGALILLGLWVRLAAVISAILMIVAYFMAHASNGWSPLANKGEPAVLFFVAFLVLATYGAGKLSLEKALKKKECF